MDLADEVIRSQAPCVAIVVIRIKLDLLNPNKALHQNPDKD
jgi:hypothetical protein